MSSGSRGRFGCVLCQLLAIIGLILVRGCTTIRVVDSPRTADLDFLLTEPPEQAGGPTFHLMPFAIALVYVDTQWLVATVQPSANFPLENELARHPRPNTLFLIGELRAKLLNRACA